MAGRATAQRAKRIGRIRSFFFIGVNAFLGRPILPPIAIESFSQFLYNRVAIQVSVQYGSHVWSITLIERTLVSWSDIALHAAVFYLRGCANPGRIYRCSPKEAVCGEWTEWPLW